MHFFIYILTVLNFMLYNWRVTIFLLANLIELVVFKCFPGLLFLSSYQQQCPLEKDVLWVHRLRWHKALTHTHTHSRIWIVGTWPAKLLFWPLFCVFLKRLWNWRYRRLSQTHTLTLAHRYPHRLTNYLQLISALAVVHFYGHFVLFSFVLVTWWAKKGAVG